MKIDSFKSVAIGVFLALSALLLGEIHGLAFGAKEDALKDHFKSVAEANASTLGSDEDVADAAEDAWKHLKVAHLHYMGLGAVSLALCLFIGLSPAGALMKTIVSSAVGFGALVYPLFWTLASFRMASMGEHAAKDSLALVAQAGAGVGFLGLLGTVVIALGWLVHRERVIGF